jgi:3-deoxy-7-phosphoheptulonate synthase
MILTMIIIFTPDHTQSQRDSVAAEAVRLGFDLNHSPGQERYVLGLIGDTSSADPNHFRAWPGVENVIRISSPYKLASRTAHPEGRLIRVHNSVFGGAKVPVIAGPCSVESLEGLDHIAQSLSSLGIKLLRGGAYKPRTSPYSFQGLGEEGLQHLAQMRERYDMGIVTEVMGENEVDTVCEYADLLQIGTRNMQNYRLLKRVGQANKPVLLKRGMSATIEEWLMAAEYIMSEGNHNVILCERGIRSFEPQLRGACDIGAMALAQELSSLPVILDPSHATGRSDIVPAVSLGGIAAGTNGLILEVHDHPERAHSDGAQSITPEVLESLLRKGRLVATALGRTLS